jgi:hypothetical protein
MITSIEKLSPKFRHISIDPDTRIKVREERTVISLDAVYEKWVWEGIIGQSYIFVNEDVEHLSDAELLEKLGLSEKEAALKRGERYTFVNFGFENPC